MNFFLSRAVDSIAAIAIPFSASRGSSDKAKIQQQGRPLSAMSRSSYEKRTGASSRTAGGISRWVVVEEWVCRGVGISGCVK